MRKDYTLISLLTIALAMVITSCEDKEEPHFAAENWDSADLVQGGLMYDKWWKINDATEPSSDFDPLWSTQTTNTSSESTTWRCKECHGWDYIGKNGRYSSGSHYTGFAGIWQARTMDKEDLFDAIKDAGGDHDLSAVLSDNDVLDLSRFVAEGLIDVTLYIDENGVVTGDSANGKTAQETADILAYSQTLPTE